MSYEPTPPPGGPSDHWCGTYSRFVEEWCEACRRAACTCCRACGATVPCGETPCAGACFCGLPEADPVTIPNEAMNELLEPVLASYGPRTRGSDGWLMAATPLVDVEAELAEYARIERMRNDPVEFARMVMPAGSVSEAVLAQLRLLAAGRHDRVLLTPRVIERPAAEGGRRVTYFVIDDVLPTFPEIDLAKALARHEAAFSLGKYHTGDLLDILRRAAPLPRLWHRDKLDLGTRIHRRYDRMRRDARVAHHTPHRQEI